MKKRLILITAATATLFLTGCSQNMTKEKLLQEMSTATEEKQISSMSLEVDFDMGIGSDGFSLNMGMDMDMDAKIHTEAKEAYLSMNIGASMLGETTDYSMEMFILPEGDDYVCYLYNASSDSWEKEIYDDVALLFDTSDSDDLSILDVMDINDITLAKDKETIDDTKVYTLSYTLAGETLETLFEDSDIFEQFEEAFETDDDLVDLFDVDWKALSVPVTLYVDAETYLPVQIDMDIEGLDTLIAPLVDEIMLLSGTDVDVDISFDTFHLMMNHLGYDAPELPELPDEALNASEADDTEMDDETGYEEAFDPLIAAGESYTISEGNVSATITPPLGWYVYPADEDIEFTMYDNEDATMFFTCNIVPDISADEIKTSLIDELIDVYKDSDYYVNHGFADDSYSMNCAWVSYNDGCMIYLIWSEISPNNYIFIEFDDYTGQDLDTIMNQVEGYLSASNI